MLVAGLASPGEDGSQSRDGAHSTNGMAPHDLSQHRQQQGGHPGEWGPGGPGAPPAAHLVAPGVINSELFAREPNSVALLLGLLVSVCGFSRRGGGEGSIRSHSGNQFLTSQRERSAVDSRSSLAQGRLVE